MSLKISKTNVPAYDYLSEDGSMTNAATRSVIIDKTGSPATKESSALTLYLVAAGDGGVNLGSYTGITIEATDADASADGITWQLSLNGSTWTTTISPADMDCESADAVTTIYAKIVVDNGVATVAATGNYAAEFNIAATENPPA